MIFPETDIERQKKWIFMTISALVKTLNIEEMPFKTLDIVEIASNHNINELRKIISNLAKKRNIISHKINQGSPKNCNTNMKSFTEEKIRHENYQEAYKYTEKYVTNLKTKRKLFTNTSTVTINKNCP